MLECQVLPLRRHGGDKSVKLVIVYMDWPT